MNEWPRVPIRGLCESIIDCVNKTAPTVAEPTPYRMIRTTNVKNGRVDLGRVKYVDSATYERWVRRGQPQAGDIILTREAPLGEVGILPDASGVFLGQRLVMYRVDEARADRHFLLAAMRGHDVQTQIKSLGSGSTVEHMRVPDCSELLIACPSLDHQQRIGAVLSAFEELIAINERRIELLEDLARSLYREWFVRNPTSPQWELTTVGEMCDVVRGRSYKRAELAETDGVPFLNLKCVAREGGFRHGGLKRYTGRFKESQQVVAGETLVAVTDMTQERRIVGQAFRMPPLGEPYAVPSLDLTVVRPRDPRMRTYVYSVLRYSGFSERVRHYANGANVLHLAVERILEAPIVAPDRGSVDRFSAAMQPIMDRAEACEVVNRALARTRDLLLPRLVTGRLDISDVDLGDLLLTETAA